MEKDAALLKAIDACRGAAELARRIGVTRQNVHQWRRVPGERVLAVETATNGTVTRHEMRPDIYGTP
jgi:DNA-binding transcriptional regulator YdaS (Cro superfamily)